MNKLNVYYYVFGCRTSEKREALLLVLRYSRPCNKVHVFHLNRGIFQYATWEKHELSKKNIPCCMGAALRRINYCITRGFSPSFSKILFYHFRNTTRTILSPSAALACSVAPWWRNREPFYLATTQS